MDVDPLKDIIKDDLNEQLSASFNSMDTALRSMQAGFSCVCTHNFMIHVSPSAIRLGGIRYDFIESNIALVNIVLMMFLKRFSADMSRFVLERLRIEQLTKVNYSSLPLYDASHPHWKTDLTETSLESTNYFVPGVNTLTHTHTHTHTRTCAHMQTHTHACTHTRTHARTRTQRDTHTHTHTHMLHPIHIHTHLHTQTHTHAQTHLHTHIHTHTHMYEHIHTHTPSPSHACALSLPHTRVSPCSRARAHTHTHAHTH